MSNEKTILGLQLVPSTGPDESEGFAALVQSIVDHALGGSDGNGLTERQRAVAADLSASDRTALALGVDAPLPVLEPGLVSVATRASLRDGVSIPDACRTVPVIRGRSFEGGPVVAGAIHNAGVWLLVGADTVANLEHLAAAAGNPLGARDWLENPPSREVLGVFTSEAEVRSRLEAMVREQRHPHDKLAENIAAWTSTRLLASSMLVDAIRYGAQAGLTRGQIESAMRQHDKVAVGVTRG